MAVPYTREDPFSPGHICLACRKELRSLEVVEELGPDRYVHVGCGGLTPSSVAASEERLRQLELMNRVLQEKVQALRSQLRLSQKHNKELAATVEKSEKRFSEVTPRMTKNGDRLRELSLQLRAQRKANELLKRKVKDGLSDEASGG